MNRFLFGVTTLFIGFFLHLFFQRFLAFYGIGPHFLLLCVIAMGFIRGPLMAESFGFLWGLCADATGVNMFGLNSFLLVVAGYTAGQLRRRVASERPVAQIVIAIFSTIYFVLGGALFQFIFNESANAIIARHVVISGILNILLVMAIFWITEKWIWMWRLETEHI